MAPVRIRVPVPALDNPLVPVMTEPTVPDVLFTVKEPVVLPMASVPPERVIAPEADPKVRLAVLTVPLTVMVPVASPRVEVPKFRASAVAVVMLAPVAATPVESVLQPCVASPVVGAAQVPPAVPKPAVVPLSSQ